MTEVLTAPHVVERTYTRSTGPVIGAFLAGLRDRRILGVRASARPTAGCSCRRPTTTR
jgi:hypothetical protein